MIKAPRNRTKKSDEEFYAPVPVSPAGALDRSAASRLLDAFLAAEKPKPSKPTVRTLKISKLSSRHPRSTTPQRFSWAEDLARRTLWPWLTGPI